MPQHRPRKRFGQHFLHDQGVIDRIIAAIAPVPGQCLVEIGPGTGALTLPLLQHIGELHVVELDRDLAAELMRLCQGAGTLHMHCQDALDFNIRELAAGRKDVRIIGNLPYNISTPLIFHLLDYADCISDMVFMLQEEVVDRLDATPGNKTYGRLSVMVQSTCRVEKLFTVRPASFTPQPGVASAMVKLTPQKIADIPGRENFIEIVRQCFNHRRKTLRNALKGIVSAQQMQNLGISPGLRPEQLTVEQFINLANIDGLKANIPGHPDSAD
jgi:16S rRNA (adenine1518-N6/adenine1519-N6)-dimethyltransferase